MAMTEAEKEQLTTLLQNIEENKKSIPTFSDLCDHSVFWSAFSLMKKNEQQEVRDFIKIYIEKKVESLTKTKWGQLFKRFFESHSELFWKFRDLNENDECAQNEAFQIVGKEVEQELFRLEGILTERMLNQEKGLDKVVESFYNIVYLFFPRYNYLD